MKSTKHTRAHCLYITLSSISHDQEDTGKRLAERVPPELNIAVHALIPTPGGGSHPGLYRHIAFRNMVRPRAPLSNLEDQTKPNHSQDPKVH